MGVAQRPVARAARLSHAVSKKPEWCSYGLAGRVPSAEQASRFYEVVRAASGL